MKIQKQILIVARPIKEVEKLESGKEYYVDEIMMGQSNTSVMLVGIKGCFNSVNFRFIHNGREIDIYKSALISPYEKFTGNNGIWYKDGYNGTWHLDMTKQAAQSIALTYGYEPQSRQLIEEMAELTVAINKFWRVGQKPASDEVLNKMREARSSMIEEIADVGIMLEQITYLLDAHSDVEEITKEKVHRQLERIKKESEGKKQWQS